MLSCSEWSYYFIIMRSVGTRIQTTSTAQELSPGSYHQQKYKLGGVINNMETLRTDPSRNSITYVNEVHQSGMRSEDSSALLSENNNLRDLTHRLMVVLRCKLG